VSGGVLGAEVTHPVPILLIIGFAVLAGSMGAGLFRRLRIPQVVGYIAIGVLVGRSGFRIIDRATLDALEPFHFFALGVIGFMIGGELHREVFRRQGRQFLKILLGEGLGAFVVVTAAVTVLAWALTGDAATSAALGIVLGAVSSATAPAATVEVLREYKTRGLLTTTVFALVALDDGLALGLYSVAASVAAVIVGAGGGSFLGSIAHAARMLLGAVALGAAAGVALNFAIRRVRERGKTLTAIVGMLALVLGLARLLDLEVILAAMVLGVTITNMAARRTNEAFQIMERFAPPIYVLFFVFVGAGLEVAGMPPWMWAVAGVYVLGRSGGKILGARLGAAWADAPRRVRNYLGLCLFDQAGVAIGLAILARSRFGDASPVGAAVFTIITASTFLVQIIAPPCVKLAAKRAGEVGLNVTEEDLALSYRVGDVMEASPPRLGEGTTLAEILRTIASSDTMAYPVTDDDGRLTGVITIHDLKQSFLAEGLMNWLVAHDLMQPPSDIVTRDTPLQEAMLQMREQGLDYLPVVASAEDRRLEGMLEYQGVERMLSREILRRRQQADGVPAA
jgi:CBS domain-containing protein